MLKKLISLVLATALLFTVGVPISAEETEVPPETEAEAPVILMNGEALTEAEDSTNKYTYIVESLEDLPVLSCKFDSTVYSALITQPTRDNGYIGTVTVTDIKSGDTVIHTVNVYDNNTFKSHFINLGGDPWVTYHDGWYYYMVTGNGFYVSKSRELERVNSNPVSVFKLADLVDSINFNVVAELWAPELHFINGYWYIYFTAYDGETSYKDENNKTKYTGTAKNHRMYVLKSKTDDAQGEYEFMGQLKEIDSDYINDEGWINADYNIKPGHWAIDQSIFKWNEKLYAVWSGWPSYSSVGQRIYIAEMSDPCTISGARVEISRPEFAYETYSMIPPVNEAPQALISPDGKTLNIAFSVNRFDDSHYSLGLLTLKDNGDPLNADDWIKTDKPVFETNLENSTYSVGHCSFVPSPDGSENYVIYHARRGEDTNTNPREIRVQQFYWNDDGTPCFTEAISADSLVQIPSGTANLNRTVLEAEDAALAGGAFVVTSETKGIVTYDDDYYSGGKRISLIKEGRTATFKYTAEKAGKYTLTLLASGNNNTHSGLAVTVNGTEYKVKIHGGMGNVNIFAYYDLADIELQEGENTIVVGHTAAYQNGAYLDRLDIVNEQYAACKWAAQDKVNAECTKTPVIREKLAEKYEEIEYEKEYIFDSFGDFDKYWYNSEPFRQEYGDEAITTVRPGGNKRLLVSYKKFHNIADFKASVEITPSAAHTAADNGVEVQNEIVTEEKQQAINSGIIFRIGEMRDYTSNVISFSGYRCFLIANSNNELKIQAHKYYFTDETSEKAANKVLSTSSAISYTPGETYILEVEVVGNILNAVAYSTSDPETVIKLTNINLKPVTTLEYEDSGRIGIYAMPVKGRVTFNNFKVTPYYTSAGLTCSYGKLNELEYYDTILPSTRTFSETEGIITVPTGVSKLLIKDKNAQDIANFKATTRFKITQSNASIQSGFAFRIGDYTTATPGLTGYVVYLQRTTSKTFTGDNISNINVSLTKYGKKKDGTLNGNCGTSPNTTSALLSDKTTAAEIIGTEIDMQITVIDNTLTATVNRADNPEMTATFSWVLDDLSDNVNIEHNSDYYKNGRLGFFSNGAVKISHIQFEPLFKEYNISTNSENGNVSTNILKATSENKIDITISADEGYYFNPTKLTINSADGTEISFNKENNYSDISAVYSFVSPKSDVNIECAFCPILKGDTNADQTINLKDLVKLKKHLVGIDSIYALSNSDTDCDNTINSADLVSLRKILIKQ